MDQMPDIILSRKTRLLESIGLVILGYFCYSVADLCSKKLQEIYDVHQVLTISALFGLVVTGIWLPLRHGIAAFFPSNLKLHLLRSLTLIGGSYCAVSALKILPLADFYGIIFTLPFFVMIMAVLLLGEKIGWHRCLAALVGFSGILVLAAPQFDHIGLGVVFALSSAFCAASNIICLRKIGPGAPLPLYGFYAFLGITIFNTVMMLATDTYQPITADYAPYFVIIGPILMAAVLFVAIGFSKAPEAIVVAPFQYTQTIWGVLFGWFFFHTMPTTATWTGLAMIIGAGLYSLRREYMHAHHLE
jgi:drug/metabolite transporter (DMT)-like permease